MAQGQGLFLEPRPQKVADFPLAAGIAVPGEDELPLPVEQAHQPAEFIRALLQIPAKELHQLCPSLPEAHAVAVILRGDLEVEGGPSRPVLVPGAHAEPQVILVRSPAVEPSGIPIDTADLQQERLMGEHPPQALIDLLTQSPGRLQQMLLIVLLMGQKPLPFVIEADAPHKVHCLLRISLKHTVLSSCFL